MNVSNKESSKEVTLSICVVVYNHEDYIDECMAHFFSQKMDFDYEIIIGNDCSTDQSAERLSVYEDRAYVINRTENYGLCANMYDILLKARGKYVFTFSGDDYLCDDLALQKQVDFLDEHPEYYSVSGWNYMYRESNGSFTKCQDESCPQEFTITDFLSIGFIPTTHGMMRNTFANDRDSNGYLTMGVRNNEEMKMWLYTLSKGKRRILPEFFHVYRNVDREGMSNYNSTHSLLDMFEDNYRDLVMLRKLLGDKYNFMPIILIRSNYYWLRIGSQGESVRKMFKMMQIKDLVSLLGYKIYLKLHSYQNPPKWEKRRYLITER